MSVRLRLTLWYVLALCIGFALFGGVILWQVTRAANAALDGAMMRRAMEVAADLSLSPRIHLRNDVDEGGGRLGETTFWVRILDGQGRVVIRQGPTLAGVPANVLGDTVPGLGDWEMPGDAHIRLAVIVLPRIGHLRAVIQVLTTTTQVDETRRRVLLALGLGGLGIVAASFLGGLFLAGRVLRPIDRITRLAADIGAGDLHRRVAQEMMDAMDPPRADELGRLASTFDAMLTRLEDASEQRRRLTADAAHELRTPVATITTGVEVALQRERSAAEYRATLTHVLDESRYMARLVDDLLLLSLSDAGRLPMDDELVEVDEVCRAAVRAFTPAATEKKMTLGAFVPSSPILVRGDEGRLAQVLRNLLDNAVRHTPRGGHVEVDVRALGEGDGDNAQVEIGVTNSGTGILPADQARIFERFYRVRAGGSLDESEPQSGNGLGLAICRAIVRAHGGDIYAENGDGPPSMPGSRVIVRLPRVDASAESDTSPP